jgi:4-hydroxybenzoyl-CoA thioesterase
VFRTSLSVRFGDIDAAGIAYYPRLVNFLHEAFEDFFASHVGRPFPQVLKEGLGFPIVKLEIEFVSPVRYGDTLEVALAIERVGGASVDIRYEATVSGRPVFSARSTLVAVDGRTFRPVPVPDWLRARFETARN